MDGIIRLTDAQRKSALEHFRFGENARISRRAVLRTTTLCTFAYENSALAAKLILHSRLESARDMDRYFDG